jgi:hypothetical protein
MGSWLECDARMNCMSFFPVRIDFLTVLISFVRKSLWLLVNDGLVMLRFSSRQLLKPRERSIGSKI